MLRRHHAVSAPVSLARDNGDLRHSRLCKRVDELGAVRNDTAVFLRHTRHKARHIFKRYQRNVEAITESNETRALNRRVDIQHTRKKRGLISDNPDRTPTQPREPDTDVRRKHLLHFEEVTIIDDRVDHFANVVRLIRSLGNQVVEFRLNAIMAVAHFNTWRIFKIVRRNKRKEFTHDPQCMLV